MLTTLSTTASVCSFIAKLLGTSLFNYLYHNMQIKQYIDVIEFLEVDIMAIDMLTSSRNNLAASKDMLNTDKETGQIQ